MMYIVALNFFQYLKPIIIFVLLLFKMAYVINLRKLGKQLYRKDHTLVTGLQVITILL